MDGVYSGVHQEDLTVGEPALNAVSFIKIDWQKGRDRHRADILRNIAARVEREEKLKAL